MKLKPQGANQTEITLADGTVILFSYQTPVAAFVPGQGYFVTAQHHSRTTNKHVMQWLRLAAENPPDTWEECGQCSGCHPAGYTGDCRDDYMRWPPSKPAQERPQDFFNTLAKGTT